MNPSIPANIFVNVIPAVLQAGANDLGMNAVFLDNTGDTSVPVGMLKQFGSALDVADWYGANSVQAALATDYFSGFVGASQIPAALYFAQYNTAAVAAYLRGGPLSLTLSQLQAFSGVLTIAVNGETVTSANINLSSATSFSNAAALIQTGLQTAGGIWTGTVTTVNTTEQITVDATSSGQLHIGDAIVSANVGVGAVITSFGSYTPGAGTGTVNVSVASTASAGPTAATVSSTATCTYDSLRAAFVITSPTTGAASTIAYPTTDAFATDLLLTAATGAVLSQGAAAASPAGLMNSIVGLSRDWATFTTVQDPDSGAAGGPIKVEFATWNAGQNAAYMYVAYDTDPAASQGSDSSCFGQQVAALVGTFPVWDSTETQAAAVAAFVCGITAAINFEATGGRTTFAYRSSPVLVPDITSEAVYQAIVENGYSGYVNVATRTTQFQWLQNGQVSGAWKWADSYVNQIFWNSRFQNDLAELEAQVPSIPYTQAGYNMIRETLSPDIQAMGAFGAWQPGVTLSGSQAVAVNTAAGLTISGILQQQGWYLQVEDPGSTVRGERGSPDITFWYTDGDSVQQMNMTSTDIE